MAGIIPKKTPIPHQAPAARIRNFDEVALGYGEEEALREASRCLRCKTKPCVAGCPVAINIPRFIAQIGEKDFAGAIRTIREASALPAVCGRVCPQENQCERVCTLAKKHEPVGIGRLERFAADYEIRSGIDARPRMGEPTGLRAAVIGSGPASLTVAGDLAVAGHSVTVFEAFHKAGGVLYYGIPEFRLPKAIVEREIDYIRSLGVEVRTNFVVGRTATIAELMERGYGAVFIGVGAGLPRFLEIPGENALGVYTANEYLTRTNLMRAYEFPRFRTPIKRGRHAAVFGGGNVAIDAARTALRLGAESVTLIYRRSREEMPARAEEVGNAEEEGIEFLYLAAPVRFLADDGGWVRAVECLRMRLGAPDASGRRRPEPIPGSEFSREIDIAIVAIGNTANPLLCRATPGLATDRSGHIIASEDGATSIPGVYAGGDIVTGSATVIEAMGAGRASARAMDAYLRRRADAGGA
ncbi:MAG: NADPH-dependent glutamate synthase [Planctomycetes bacterium]|nr:NADPH-dependent glutamate synthase [Planctomycetota bacterium]